MTEVKTPEVTRKRYAERSLKAFLEGGKYAKDHKPKTVNWVAGIIRASGVSGEDLQSIFSQLRDYGDQELYRQAYTECQRRGFL